MAKIKVTDEVRREIARYRQFMLERKHTKKTMGNYAKYLARFLCWQTQDVIYPLKSRIFDFLNVQSKYKCDTIIECRTAVHLYFRMKTGKNYKEDTQKAKIPEIEEILKRFYGNSVNIKRILPASALQETVIVRNFLEDLQNKGLRQYNDITAYNIREYTVTKLSHLSDSSKGRMITAIRNFFKFQQFEGVNVHKSIFQLPLSPAIWKKSAFPQIMDVTVFNNLHEIPDCGTPEGKRSRCIILCFTELAMRCIEVAALDLDDFNWHEGSVTIKNTKNGIDRKLPVSKRLGQAVIDYVRNARPKTVNRTLFVRFKQICGEPMGTEQIRGVVRRIYGKTGTGIQSTGTHILRRTAASAIFNAGNSLKMTADILGHASLDSTVFYVKTDIDRLRRVAAPWPNTLNIQPATKAGL